MTEDFQICTLKPRFFRGDKLSNRNNYSLLASFVLAGKIAGKESRQQHVAVAEEPLFSLKNARMVQCAVG